MHVVPVSHPLLRLCTNLSLFTLLVPLRYESLAVEVVAEILSTEPRLGENQRLGGVGVLNADDGRLAERVDFFELLGGEHVRAPLVSFQFIGDVEFLEEPENALGAGLLQPGQLVKIRHFCWM